LTESDSRARSVYIWVCEGTWRASVDAALSLAPAGASFALLHVSSGEVPDAARGAAARRLGRGCEKIEIQTHGHAERVVVSASAQADLLIVARDGDQARLGPKSLGKTTRFVVDHAACPVLLVWPRSAPDVATIPPPPPHRPHPPDR